MTQEQMRAIRVFSSWPHRVQIEFLQYAAKRLNRSVEMFWT